LRQRLARLLKVIDDILHDFVEFLVDYYRVVAMDTRDQIRTLANVDLVLVAPLDTAMVRVDWFQFQSPPNSARLIVSLESEFTNSQRMKAMI
jgi:hypothetical protein